MNNPLECRHEHLRQTVQVTMSMTVGAWNKSLTKKVIRNKDAPIDVVEWDAPINYTYCADCGLVMEYPKNLYGEIDRINRNLYNPTGKINRIKAVRELTNCSLKEAKYFVDSLYWEYGNGDKCPHLQNLTLQQAEDIIRNETLESYCTVLAKWSGS